MNTKIIAELIDKIIYLISRRCLSHKLVHKHLALFIMSK